jgi:galactokinase
MSATAATQSFEQTVNGRVNLIGEHTDYNGGWVLPTSIPQALHALLTPRADRQVVCYSEQMTPATSDAKVDATAASKSFNLGEESKTGLWVDYIQGATKTLAGEGFSINGFDLYVDSKVPVGSGLSSSAALEIAVLKLLRSANDWSLTDRELARIGQRIENEFVGAPVGIMDQMACAMARWGEALFLDTLTLESKTVQLPLDAMDLIVINSGVQHRNNDGGYAQRRSECEAACRELGVKLLREIDDVAKLANLPDRLQRRARHVVTENARVHEAVAAIGERDLKKLGELFLASHASMRDDYGVSIAEIDTLVELCAADERVFGARLTGGGFGGSIVAISQKGTGASVAKAVTAAFHARFAARATVLVS